MKDKTLQFCLLSGILGLTIAVLLFHTVLSHIITLTPKIFTIFSLFLLIASTVFYLFIRPSNIRSLKSKVLTFTTLLLFVLCIFSLIIGARLSETMSFLFFTFIALDLYLAYLNAILGGGKLGISVAMVFALIAIFLISTYMLFPPSLGNDAWRDIMQSVEIQKSGYIPPLINKAYPIPLVSLTYSVYSLVTSVDVRWTTAFIGLEYLFVVLLSALLYVRRLIKLQNTTSSDALDRILLFTSLLVILNPLIVTWSLEPIPQAYAVALVLLILLLISFGEKSISAYIATLPLSVAAILAHGGVNLWFIAFLSFWLSVSYFLKEPEDGIIKRIRKMLRTISMITLAYWVYTTIIEVIIRNSYNIWSLLIDQIIIGVISRNAGTTTPVPWYSVALSYSPFYVSLVFAFVGWCVYEGAVYLRKDAINVTFFSGMISVALALIGYTFNPYLALERYLGLSAFVILVIPAGIGLYAIYIRGFLGRVFISLVIATMILGIVFGGFYTPDYAPLGQPSWLSQKAPPTYGEARNLECLSLIAKEDNSILIDWRAGVILEYYNIIHKGVKIPSKENAVNITPIGSYGLIINEEYIIKYIDHKNAIFIYRKEALEKLGLIIGVNEEQLLKIMNSKEKIYDSNKIQVFAGS